MRRPTAAVIATVLVLSACSGDAGPPTDHAASSSNAAPETAGVWREMSMSPLGPRAGALALWTGRELIVMGGSDGDPCPPGADCVLGDPARSDGAAYDPISATWRQIAEAPAALEHIDGVVHDGDVFVSVIDLHHERLPQSLLRYDPETDDWDEIGLPEQVPQGSGLASTPIGLVVYNTSHENGVGDDVRYDPEADGWLTLPRDPLGPAYDRTMLATSSGVVLIAVPLGQSSAQPPLYTGAVLNAEEGEWSRLADAPVVASNPTWHVLADQVVNPSTGFSAGGENNGWGMPHPYGGVLDPESGQWTPLIEAPRSTGALAGYSAANDRHALDLSGWIYEPAAGTWLYPGAPPGVPDEGAAVAWMGDQLVVWGGVVWGPERGQLLADGWFWTPPAGG